MHHFQRAQTNPGKDLRAQDPSNDPNFQVLLSMVFSLTNCSWMTMDSNSEAEIDVCINEQVYILKCNNMQIDISIPTYTLDRNLESEIDVSM